jgi:Cu2+-exporting ATPase
MTCNGCRSHVEKTLSEVEGVSSAAVDLEKKEATIVMEKHIPIETFQKALQDDGGRYSIEMPNEVENGAMKHTYHIAGMTCNGCRSHVENTLSKIEGVSAASVNLEKSEATIEMDQHIPIEKFQEAF